MIFFALHINLPNPGRFSIMLEISDGKLCYAIYHMKKAIIITIIAFLLQAAEPPAPALYLFFLFLL